MGLATIISIVNGLFTLVKNLLGLRKRGGEKAMQADPRPAIRAAAEIHRDAARDAAEDVEHARNETDRDLGRLDDAGSDLDGLRAGASIVADAIARANAADGDPSARGDVQRTR